MKSTKLYWGIAMAIWFSMVMALLYLSTIKSLTEFDPSQQLVNQAALSTFDQDFKSKIQQYAPILNNTVVHFTQSNCDCNKAAEQHIESVKKLASEQLLTNIIINDEPKNMLELIPSTPAIAVFDHDGELTYLGPYSAGYSCTIGNGIVESFISNKEKSSVVGASVISQTRGCYCAVTAS